MLNATRPKLILTSPIGRTSHRRARRRAGSGADLDEQVCARGMGARTRWSATNVDVELTRQALVQRMPRHIGSTQPNLCRLTARRRPSSAVVVSAT